jgi:hypothetical protein
LRKSICVSSLPIFFAFRKNNINLTGYEAAAMAAVTKTKIVTRCEEANFAPALERKLANRRGVGQLVADHGIL